MALTATATQGFELLRRTTSKEMMWLPGDPGVTFTEGDKLSMSGGVLIAGTDSAADAIFTCRKTVVCPAATQSFVKPAELHDKRTDAKDLTLVLCEVDVPDGVPVHLCTFANQADEIVVSYSGNGASTYIECTTGFGADDRPNGALLYVYEGPGAGECNLVADYDHAGGNVELELILHRQMAATLTTASKFIVLASAAAANGVGLFGRVDLKDKNELDVTDGADDGDYIVYCDWRQLASYMKNLKLPVIKRNSLYGA